jgi:hypothetical protein
MNSSNTLSHKKRCSSLTLKGVQCQKNAYQGSNFCSTHLDSIERVESFLENKERLDKELYNRQKARKDEIDKRSVERIHKFSKDAIDKYTQSTNESNEQIAKLDEEYNNETVPLLNHISNVANSLYCTSPRQQRPSCDTSTSSTPICVDTFQPIDPHQELEKIQKNLKNLIQNQETTKERINIIFSDIPQRKQDEVNFSSSQSLINEYISPEIQIKENENLKQKHEIEELKKKNQELELQIQLLTAKINTQPQPVQQQSRINDDPIKKIKIESKIQHNNNIQMNRINRAMASELRKLREQKRIASLIKSSAKELYNENSDIIDISFDEMIEKHAKEMKNLYSSNTKN